MKKLNQTLLKSSISVALVTAFCLTTSAESLTTKNSLTAPPAPLLNKNKESVNFSWAINSGYVPNPTNVLSSSEESVEYWQNISGRELNLGLKVYTSAPGALVRITEKGKNLSGLQAKTLAGLQPLDLDIITPRGKKMTNGRAMSLKASPQTLRDAGSPFPNGTTGFKFKENLGSGTFILKNNQKLNPNKEYVLHVFDKNSQQRLSVTRNQSTYKVGDMLTLEGDLTNNYKGMNINSVTGFVLSPSGKTMPLKIKQGSNGQFKAALPLNQKAEYGGLYEAYIDASTMNQGQAIKRRVKTAFAISNPTASMHAVSGTLQQGLPVTLKIKDVGRYEVRGVLYGMNNQGRSIPFMAASSAQWFDRGQQNLVLKFDQAIIAKSGLKAPFEIKHLQLFDQSRMASLQLMNTAIGINGKLSSPAELPSLQQQIRPAKPSEITREERLRGFLR